MGIVDEDIVAVRAATDIVAVVTEYTQLRRSGQRWVGLCPFHGEKTPSFSVNQELGLYYCFGCQAKGDVITFVREIEHLDFVGAVEWLAGRAGITLRYTDKDEGEGRKRRGTAGRGHGAGRRVVPRAAARRLPTPRRPAATCASAGSTATRSARYQLGWAPDDWDALVKALRLPNDVLRDTGLGFLNRNGTARQDFVPRPGPVPDLRRQRRRRSASAGGSCPAATARSTRTRRRPRSTRSRRCSTG